VVFLKSEDEVRKIRNLMKANLKFQPRRNDVKVVGEQSVIAMLDWVLEDW